MESGPVANPMTRYPRYAAYRPSWTPTWGGFGCLVEAEDGSWGFATASHGRPVAAVIDDYLGPRLLGESCLATEKCYDMMVRMGAPHGAAGLHSYAVSAIDLALWDLKGKLLQRPVYELIGGPARDELFCYSTGGDTDWYMELGFRATKLPCPYGPADGLEGLRKNVALVAGTRELVGDEVELMLDCWMAFDLEYAVRLGEELRPFKLKWMEEVLRSEELDAHAELRRGLPGRHLHLHGRSLRPGHLCRGGAHRDSRRRRLEGVAGAARAGAAGRAGGQPLGGMRPREVAEPTSRRQIQREVEPRRAVEA